MVLSSMPIGEYDKRLVILSKERGKIAVFAKGARRQNSAFLACSQPFTFGQFELYEGRSSYNLRGIQINNYFEEIRMNLEAAYYGMYFCELTSYFAHENEDGTDMLKLLYHSLRALLRDAIGMELVRYIFELKLISINGFPPQVFQCVQCGQEENVSYRFSSSAGGILCENCKGQGYEGFRIRPDTIYTLQFIVATNIEKLFSFTLSKEVMYELKRCIDSYRKIYIDQEMKTLKFLETLF